MGRSLASSFKNTVMFPARHAQADLKLAKDTATLPDLSDPMKKLRDDEEHLRRNLKTKRGLLEQGNGNFGADLVLGG